jgi:hypothetical protein
MDSVFDDNAPSLRNLVIGSVDTLTDKELPTRIPPTWNDRPPLLRGPRGTPETTLLLKGVSRTPLLLQFFQSDGVVDEPNLFLSLSAIR